MEGKIREIIAGAVTSLGRPDLFRQPLVSFSSADDERYTALKALIGPWHQSPAELLPEAVSVISYFVPFTWEVSAAPKAAVDASLLWAEAYREINGHFALVNTAVSDYLVGMGYAARTIPATHTYDPSDLKCMWSHRSAAAIAGLGAFGANRLLITEKGSGGRLCTVITSAPLAANAEPAKDRCLYKRSGACGLCFDVCPVKALKPDAMDKFGCQSELDKNEEQLRLQAGIQGTDVCGKCISVCPLAHIA